MTSSKQDRTLVTCCDVLGAFLALFAVTVRPMFSGLSAALHRNILIGLLVPALNKARRHSYEVKQKVQLKGIETGLEFFNAELKTLNSEET